MEPRPGSDWPFGDRSRQELLDRISFDRTHAEELSHALHTSLVFREDQARVALELFEEVVAESVLDTGA